MTAPPLNTRRRLRISADQVRAYADIADDHNPLHLDDDFARSRGFPGAIAHGLLTLGLVSTELESIWSDRWREGGRLDVRFTAPVPTGADLQLSVIATAEVVRPDRDVAEVTVTSGEVIVLRGTADVRRTR